MDSPTVWCPSCGAEYRAGSLRCSDCRVALVADQPDALGPSEGVADLVELGDWPRLSAQILRRRLESTGIPVMIEWTGAGGDATGTIVVPEEHAEFAAAVVNEVGVVEEMPDTSPDAYLGRIEEHLAAVAALIDELRTRLEEAE